MRILHTSDWHLGRSLYGRKRHEEFAAFLDWLVAEVKTKKINALLVAGDIFDTSTPGNRAQQLYYRFLHQITASNCRHLVITGGNHDSPSFLEAPRELLQAMNIHVIGSTKEDPAEEVLVLEDASGHPELIVCAVPYLRDRDMRSTEAGETLEDKDRKLMQGIRAHYEAVAGIAEQRRDELGGAIPVIAMGHLFTAGSQTQEGDGVRELYVGSLARVGANIFSDTFDYVALGHLHIPQKVGGLERIRYSGSPLPMGFGEAKQQKSLCLVEFQGQTASVELVEIPVFQRLEHIRGDLATISDRIQALVTEDASIWLEVTHEGEAIIGDLREQLEALVTDSRLEILRIKDRKLMERALAQTQLEESLADLNEEEVFARCLEAHEVPEEQRPELVASYQEILKSLSEADTQAEA